MRIGFVYPEFDEENLNGLTAAIPHVLSVLVGIGDVSRLPYVTKTSDRANQSQTSRHNSWRVPPHPRKLISATNVTFDNFDLLVGFSGNVAHVLTTASCTKYLIVQDSLTSITRSNPRIPLIVRIPLSRWYATYERFFYGLLDGIQVVTKAEAQAVRRLVPAVQIDVNPTGIESKDPPNQINFNNRDRPVMAVLGDFRSTRNILIAKHATRVLEIMRNQTLIDYSLKIIGWGANNIPQQSWLIRKDSVAEVESELSDVSMLLSVDQHSTGIKTSVLRALAAGLPCVVSQQVATPILENTHLSAADSGLVVVDENVSRCAQTIIELIHNQLRLSQLSNAAYRCSQFFTWKMYKERIKANLSSLISQ